MLEMILAGADVWREPDEQSSGTGEGYWCGQGQGNHKGLGGSTGEGAGPGLGLIDWCRDGKGVGDGSGFGNGSVCLGHKRTPLCWN